MCRLGLQVYYYRDVAGVYLYCMIFGNSLLELALDSLKDFLGKIPHFQRVGICHYKIACLLWDPALIDNAVFFKCLPLIFHSWPPTGWLEGYDLNKPTHQHNPILVPFLSIMEYTTAHLETIWGSGSFQKVFQNNLRPTKHHGSLKIPREAIQLVIILVLCIVTNLI